LGASPLDHAKKNIRINAVLPGNIETPMMDRFTGGDIQKAIDLEPVGRLGSRRRSRRLCFGWRLILVASLPVQRR
jgi:NAD(P)-dependent dehydrogenase (short-subunit alcohol dehydrogenase family)